MVSFLHNAIAMVTSNSHSSQQTLYVIAYSTICYKWF